MANLGRLSNKGTWSACLAVGLITALSAGFGLHKRHASIAAELARQHAEKIEAAKLELEQTAARARQSFEAGLWDEAAVLFRKAAEGGDARSQRHWGECLERGLGVEADPAAASGWYRKAMDAGDVPAKTRVADCLFRGIGSEADIPAALVQYREAAEAGEANAQLRMGELLAEGVHLDKSPEKAVEWYRKSAEQGNVRAQGLYGDCLNKGRGIEENDPEALVWLEKAARQGDPLAQRGYGYFLEKGLAVKQDYGEAAKWYRLAAAQGDVKATNNLGVLYLKGSGVEKDEVEAFRLFRKAADEGDAGAEFNLGHCHEHGLGVAKDTKKAFDLYSKAASMGNESGITGMALCYRSGIGVEIDHTQVVKLCEQESLGENMLALNLLGLCYRNGQGVTKDAEKGNRYLEKSANLGYNFAAYNLGKHALYDENYELARTWFRRSADLGHAGAMVELATLLEDGKGAKADLKEASKWYLKAAEMGNHRAQTSIGCAYGWGLGVKRNEAEAIKWLEKAAAQGDSYALTNMGEIYRFPRQIPRDLGRAFKLYQQSADAGNSAGMRCLAKAFHYGYGVQPNGEKALLWYRKALKYEEVKDEDIYYHLGYLYSNHALIPMDEVKMLRCYKKSVERGSWRGMMALANCHALGIGVEKNTRKAVEWYDKAAESGPRYVRLEQAEQMAKLGDPDAYKQALGYVDELTTKQKFIAGMALRKKAHVFTEDPVEKVNLLRKAASLGNGASMADIAECYAKGTGVKKDLEEAAKWYAKAAKNKAAGGDLTGAGAFGYSECLSEGIGVERNPQEAEKWLKKAVAVNNPSAQLKKGRLAQAAGLHEEAFNCFMRAAVQQNAEAQHALGRCYEAGEGVGKDPETALVWYRRSAHAGLMEGQLSCGKCLLHGIGGRKSVGLAKIWLQMAYRQGSEEAGKLLAE